MNGKIIFTLLIPFALGLLMACNQTAEQASDSQENSDKQEDTTSQEASAAQQQSTANPFNQLLDLFASLPKLPIKITSSYKDGESAHPMDGKAIAKDLWQDFLTNFYDKADLAREVPAYAVYQIPLTEAKTILVVRVVPEEEFQSSFYILDVNTKTETLDNYLLLANLELSGGSDAAETNTAISKTGEGSYELAVTYSSSELQEGERVEDEEVTGYIVDANGITEIKE